MLYGILALAAVRGGALELSEVAVGGEYTAFATRNVRLGYQAGRPFTFYLNFSLAAKSSLHESNNEYSSQWSTLAAGNGTTVRDLIVTKSLVLTGTFTADAAATASFLSFGDLVSGEGGYMCRNRVGVGPPPAECTRGAAPTPVSDCSGGSCWVPVTVPDEPLSIAAVQTGVVLAGCVVHGTLGGASVCLSPAGTVVRGGQTYASYTLGFGSANPEMTWWYDGKGRGEIYVTKPFMKQVEAAALVALATVTFVLWCEQTAVVTTYVKSAATGGVVPPSIHAFSGSGANYILILAADISATLAYGLTAMCYRIGRTIISHEASALLPTAYSSMLAISACAIAWVSTLLVGILALQQSPPDASADPASVAAYAAKAVSVRCAFEVATLIGIHAFLPSNALAEYSSVVGLLFGLVTMIVLSRDLCFVVWLGARWPAALVAVLWVITYQYAAFALILPAVAASSAVSSANNTALLYAATLTLQACAAGVMDALRKFQRA